MSFNSFFKLCRIPGLFLYTLFSIAVATLLIKMIAFVLNHNSLPKMQWLIIFILSGGMTATLFCHINRESNRIQPLEHSVQDVAVEVEDKPPEYEKVIEDAPPYTTVLMEDSYGVRLDTEINLDGDQQVRYECTSEVVTLRGSGQGQNNGAFGMSLGSGDAAHELSDPELPTYEEAVLIVGNSVDPSSF